jgi:hypothetical protein
MTNMYAVVGHGHYVEENLKFFEKVIPPTE